MRHLGLVISLSSIRPALSIGSIAFTPALPLIMNHFGISKSLSQMTLVAFIFVITFSFLFYGPLANRFGRRTTLRIGFGIGLIGSIVCVSSYYFDSYMVLILGRVIQAIGVSSGPQTAATMMGDVISSKDARRASSIQLTIMTVAVMFSLVMCGFLVQYFDWVASFYFLLFYDLFVLILTLFLKETKHDVDESALEFETVSSQLLEKFRKSKIVLSAVFIGLVSAFNFFFFIEAPYIVMDDIHSSPAAFGTYSLLFSISYIVGGLKSTLTHSSISMMGILGIGLAVLCFGTIAMLILFYLGYISMFTMFFTAAFALIGRAIVQPNAGAYALSYAKNKAIGASVLYFIRYAVVTVCLFVFVMTYSMEAIILPISFLCLCLLAATFYFILLFLNKQKA